MTYIGIRKSEFVAKTHHLSWLWILFIFYLGCFDINSNLNVEKDHEEKRKNSHEEQAEVGDVVFDVTTVGS